MHHSMDSLSNNDRTYNVILLGADGVGKSTFLTKYSTGTFNKRYTATDGVDTHSLVFHTTDGKIILNIWNVAGREKYMGYRPTYLREADGVILMFNLTSKISFTEMMNYYDEVMRYSKDDIENSIVILGNKSDVGERKVSRDSINSVSRVGYYMDISVKNTDDFKAPFLYLLKSLSGNPDLDILEYEREVYQLPSLIEAVGR